MNPAFLLPRFGGGEERAKAKESDKDADFALVGL